MGGHPSYLANPPNIASPSARYFTGLHKLRIGLEIAFRFGTTRIRTSSRFREDNRLTKPGAGFWRVKVSSLAQEVVPQERLKLVATNEFVGIKSAGVPESVGSPFSRLSQFK